jgi:glycosyltransferase involved in cell wall biosynthesis
MDLPGPTDPATAPPARGRIAVTSDHLQSGGAERVAVDLSALLAEQGYEVFLVTTSDKRDHYSVAAPVHRVRLSGYSEAHDFCRRERIPIAIHHSYWNVDLAERLGRSPGLSEVLCFHSSYFRSLANFDPSMFLRMREHWQQATVVTALTRETLFMLRRFLDRVLLMPNFYSGPITTPAPLEGETVLLCGTLTNISIKRPDRALAVFRQVLAERPNARLVCVGPYDLDARTHTGATLRQLQITLDLPEPSVLWLGKQVDVDPFYRQASALLLTSVVEGFPMVLLEAAAHGVPRVCFRFPGVEDMLRDGIDGFMVEQDDIDGMAGRVIRLLSDPALRRRMGAAAQEIARSFSRDKIQVSWSTLLDALHTQDPAQIAAAAGQQCADFTPEFPPLLAQYDRHLVDTVRRLVECQDARRGLADQAASAHQERDALREQLRTLREEHSASAARTLALSRQQQDELVRLRRECDRLEKHAAVLKAKLDAAWEAQTAMKQRYKEATSDHWYQFSRLNWKGKLWSLLASGSRKPRK